jgi:hypothetical protein
VLPTITYIANASRDNYYISNHNSGHIHYNGDTNLTTIHLHPHSNATLNDKPSRSNPINNLNAIPRAPTDT